MIAALRLVLPGVQRGDGGLFARRENGMSKAESHA